MTYFYVVKYALTRGIIPVRGKHCAGPVKLIEVEWQHGLNGKIYLGKGQWAETEEQAKVMAEEMRSRAIRSCKARLNKLRRLSIKVEKFVPVN